MISVMLVTGDSVLACGLEHILQETTDLRLTLTCPDTDAAIEANHLSASDIILVDGNGVRTMSSIMKLRNCCPASRICLWTFDVPDEIACQAVTIGVRGILGRKLPINTLLICLRQLRAGQVWFEERVMTALSDYPLIRLTRRESEVVALVVRGLRNKEIAYTLSLSEGTVRVYLCKLFQKLGVKDRYELALYGLRNFANDESRRDRQPSDGEGYLLSFLAMKQPFLPKSHGMPTQTVSSIAADVLKHGVTLSRVS